MENLNFETLKKTIRQQFQKLNTQYVAEKPLIHFENLPFWALFLLLLIILSIGSFVLFFVMTNNETAAFYFMALVSVAFGLLALLLIWGNRQEQLFATNANKLLLTYFANVIPFKDGYDRQSLISENAFIAHNQPIAIEEKDKLFAGVASVANLRTSFLEYHKGLLIKLPVRDSMDSNLYFVSKNMNTNFLILPKIQIFSYFPQLNNSYDIYSDFKGETAAFIAQNETIFAKIATLLDKNVVFGFLGDNIYLYYQNFEMAVLRNHNQLVDVESSQFKVSFYQLQQIYKILHLLAKVK